MARQSLVPVSFPKSVRPDNGLLLSSGRAGTVLPIGYVPLLRGDSASGVMAVDVKLAEMPKPLLNAVTANVQAWFVPKSCFPQFFSYEEFVHSYQKEDISALGRSAANPPALFQILSSTSLTTFATSTFAKTLGLHFANDWEINADVIDAYNLVYNFRLQAHSTKLPLKKFVGQSLPDAVALGRAFWPTGRFSHVVADYDRSLVVGALDLDVAAGRVPVSGIGVIGSLNALANGLTARGTDGHDFTSAADAPIGSTISGNATNGLVVRLKGASSATHAADVWAEMDNLKFEVTLADIDVARKTQAFAKMATSFAGGDITGFDADDVKVAELLQGFHVTESMTKRPWLLDSKRVPFGMIERHATDGDNLDMSVSRGRAGVQLSVNVPTQESGGYIIFTLEVLPERLDERMSDEAMLISDPEEYPNPLRDIQRIEPVDMVLNRRLDAKHTDPDDLYGYEPMNAVWRRDYTRLGGDYYSATPGAGWSESRSNIWMADIIDPAYTEDHFLAPANFPHSVFSDTNASAFDIVVRHQIAIVGQTLFGDQIFEDNGEFAFVEGGAVGENSGE